MCVAALMFVFDSFVLMQVKKIIESINAAGGKRDMRLDWEKIAD